jgi:hypothetical protein
VDYINEGEWVEGEGVLSSYYTIEKVKWIFSSEV